MLNGAMTARCTRCGWATEDSSVLRCRRCGFEMVLVDDGLEAARTVPRSRAAPAPGESQVTPVKTMLGIGNTPAAGRGRPAAGAARGAPPAAGERDDGAGTLPTAALLAAPTESGEDPARGAVPEDRLLAVLAGSATQADGETLPPVSMSGLLGDGCSGDIFGDSDPPPIATPRSDARPGAAPAGAVAVPLAMPVTPSRPQGLAGPAVAAPRGSDVALIGLWIVAVLAAGAAVTVFLIL